MSVVTDVILMVPPDSGPALIRDINARIEAVVASPCSGLNKVDRYAGGNKAVQADVYMGAFNYLSRQAVLDILAAVPWDVDDRADVRVAIKEEWDDAFTFGGTSPPGRRRALRSPPSCNGSRLTWRRSGRTSAPRRSTRPSSDA